ncbi:DUF2000 domain-containing protein [Solimicrobium silvestre]|uniref:DUF2000 domain-containing protein n=1 Tax=Solimicrobium silvestre TaxID=2099400 RepID=A0A2S9GX95_9BURK|nr:DUF2000 domain-containing protein [Solimicrobium silvestre]PRC92330.1 hypothetical protein S2091_2989 [Solimicrobium silvestre]
MKKCVIIVNKDLPLGLKANISAVLCMSLGKIHPEIVGADLIDADNNIYIGITTIPVPILETHTDAIKAAKILADEDTTLAIVFNCSALSTKDYTAYETNIRNKKTSDIVFHGLLMYGEKIYVNKITGKFPLMR